MRSSFSKRQASLMVGMVSAGIMMGCAGQESAPSEQDAVLKVAAQLNQNDVDSFTQWIKLSDCALVVSAGMVVFTPSSEASQAFYSDPNGAAHKINYAVPVIMSGGTSITIDNLKAEMDHSGLHLAGSTATVVLGFSGLLHASFPIPVVGTVNTDIEINSSKVSVALVYDSTSQRLQASSVSSQLDAHAKNCGALGWCNGIVDTFLKSNLTTMVEVPLRDALSKSLNSADVKNQLDKLLIAGYNLKDRQATPWTMVDNSLSLDAGAFHFMAQRRGP